MEHSILAMIKDNREAIVRMQQEFKAMERGAYIVCDMSSSGEHEIAVSVTQSISRCIVYLEAICENYELFTKEEITEEEFIIKNMKFISGFSYELAKIMEEETANEYMECIVKTIENTISLTR